MVMTEGRWNISLDSIGEAKAHFNTNLMWNGVQQWVNEVTGEGCESSSLSDDTGDDPHDLSLLKHKKIIKI